MSKNLRGLVFLEVLFILFLAACSNGDAEAENNSDTDSVDSETSGDGEVIELLASSGIGQEHPWWPGFFDGYIEDVESSTDGKVEFESYMSGELVPMTEEYNALQSGMIDIALPLLPNYDPGRFPLTEVTMLPLSYSNTEIASHAYYELLHSDTPIKDDKTYYELEFEENDIKAIFLTPSPEYVLSFAGTKITGVDDFQGLQLRSGSRVHELFTQYIGSTPTSMPAVDVYDALNRGALDGTFFSISDWSSWGVQEVFDFTIEGVNIGHFTNVIALSLDKWNSLPEDVQNALEESAIEQLDKSVETWVEREEVNKEANIERGGEFVNVNDLDDSSRELIESAIEQTWVDWIELKESEGQPGLEIARLWRDILIEAGGEVPESVLDL